VEPILEVVDEYINKIHEQFTWGYDVPHYLAAINGCHPNYAAFFMGKQTLTVKNIGTILRMIEPEKRSLFNKQVAESKYREIQEREINDTLTLAKLRNDISGRNVLILGPGASIKTNTEKIAKIINDEECITISVSFVPDEFDCDYTFLSNLKRYNTTFNPNKRNIKLIHTSNITVEGDDSLVVNYSELINEDDVIMDNTAMMLLNLLTRLKPKKVYLAGPDGYDVGMKNYYLDRLVLPQEAERMVALNQSITAKIEDLRQTLEIEFVTPSKYNQ
jgi:4-hydroxy 2-oxovalerate aldolase